MQCSDLKLKMGNISGTLFSPHFSSREMSEFVEQKLHEECRKEPTISDREFLLF
jgi:hypothetical protein